MGQFRNKCLYKNFNRKLAALNRRVPNNPQGHHNHRVLNNLQDHDFHQVLNNLQDHDFHQVLNNPQQVQLVPQALDTMLELAIVESLPKKNFAKVRRDASRLSEKRKKAFEMVRSQKRQKCDPNISNLSLLSTSAEESYSSETISTKKSHSPEVLRVVASSRRISRLVNGVIGTLFNNCHGDPRNDLDAVPGISMHRGKLMVQMPADFHQRNVLKGFLLRMEDYRNQFQRSIFLSESNLRMVRSIVHAVPVVASCVWKLRRKMDNAIKMFAARPEHKEFKTINRQIKLVNEVVTKYDRSMSKG